MTSYCVHFVKKPIGIAISHSWCGEKLSEDGICHKHGKQISCGSISCFDKETEKVKCNGGCKQYDNS